MNNKAQTGAFSNLVLITLFVCIVFVCGILAGILYFSMGIFENALKEVNFEIPLSQNNTHGGKNITQFQDILDIVVYPILSLKNTLPYISYFMVFGFIIALSISAYLSSKTPIFFVIHFLFLLVLTYFAIVLSNAYLKMLSDPFINYMMSDFVIYNKLMIFLPQILFFTGLLFGVLSFIVMLKPTRQEFSGTLNYGGDY